MPEANVLYAVTATVVAGLLLWVFAVLKNAKEPWARPRAVTLDAAPDEDSAEETTAKAAKETDDKAEAKAEPKDADEKDADEKDAESSSEDASKADEEKIDADATSKATPLAIAESKGKTKAAEDVLAASDKKADEKKADDAKAVEKPADDEKKPAADEKKPATDEKKADEKKADEKKADA